MVVGGIASSGPKFFPKNFSCSPGFIETPLLGKIVGADKVEPMKQQFSALAPLKRPGQTEEIAEAFAFLAIENSSFVTGQIFFVDGGFTVGSSN